jgi:hypothetical protein
MFWDLDLFPSSGEQLEMGVSKELICHWINATLFYHGDGGSRLPQNDDAYLPNYMTSYPKRL